MGHKPQWAGGNSCVFIHHTLIFMLSPTRYAYLWHHWHPNIVTGQLHEKLKRYQKHQPFTVFWVSACKVFHLFRKSVVINMTCYHGNKVNEGKSHCRSNEVAKAAVPPMSTGGSDQHGLSWFPNDQLYSNKKLVYILVEKRTVPSVDNFLSL